MYFCITRAAQTWAFHAYGHSAIYMEMLPTCWISLVQNSTLRCAKFPDTGNNSIHSIVSWMHGLVVERATQVYLSERILSPISLLHTSLLEVYLVDIEVDTAGWLGHC